ncbi:MAG: CPBP family intramembrane glutamic endopeptidase [Pseudomonadota bacterium]
MVPDGLQAILMIVTILFGVAILLRLLGKTSVDWRWLAIAAALVVINDALLSGGGLYGRISNLLPPSDWNWQGKALAIACTLGVASLPAFGWARCGLTLMQAPGSLRAIAPAALAYLLFFLSIAIAFPGAAATTETIAFQLTMPSLEEEAFYRGLLLVTLYRAFPDQLRAVGVHWSPGAALSCLLFGLAHAFSVTDGSPSINMLYFLLTALPSLLAVWIALRTGSIAIPVFLHSAGNALPLLL